MCLLGGNCTPVINEVSHGKTFLLDLIDVFLTYFYVHISAKLVSMRYVYYVIIMVNKPL